MLPTAAASSERSDLSDNTLGLYLHDVRNIELITQEQQEQLVITFQKGKQVREQLMAQLALNYVYGFAGHEIIDIENVEESKTAITEGKKARDNIIEVNLPLVIGISKKYQGLGMPLVDIIQNGNLGLMHAIEKFEFGHGAKLSSYATWWIRMYIQRGFVEESRNIRLPHKESDELNKILSARDRLYQQNYGYPSTAEIAEETDVAPNKIQFLLGISQTVSLNQPIGEELASEIGDFVYDRTAQDIGDDVAKKVDQALGEDQRIKEELYALAKLNARERQVLEARLRPDENGNQLTNNQVAELLGLGVTHQAISRTYLKAYAKVKAAAEESQYTF